MAFEKLRDYHGLYHVLHGVLSPREGIGPEDINVKGLIRRLQANPEIKEVILAESKRLDLHTVWQSEAISNTQMK